MNKNVNKLEPSEEKIKVKKFTFTWGEGSHYPFPVSFSSWEKANHFITYRSLEAENYLKTDFTVEFENEKIYEGTYEIHDPSKEPADLGAHIMSYALIGCGRRFPANIAREDAKEFLSYIPTEKRQRLAELVDNYEIIFNEGNLFKC